MILGRTGMLGSMLDQYFRQNNEYDVFSTQRDKENKENRVFQLDASKDLVIIKKIIEEKKIDYIINCIGIIKPYCKDDDPKGKMDAILINSLFPQKLANIIKKKKCKLIQIATDCVYSGREGRYSESKLHDPLDVYGKTKSLGEVYHGNVLNLRTSIIGPEIRGKVSLFEWFINQPEEAELKGFSHHKWNGMTTLQFAEMCEEIIKDSIFEELVNRSRIWHCIKNETVNKYQLLNNMADVFQKKVIINCVDNFGPPVDRTLATEIDDWPYHYEMQDIKESLMRMKKFMEKGGFYSG
jgi:dTDP-4-dehydrorhamnose reductase